MIPLRDYSSRIRDMPYEMVWGIASGGTREDRIMSDVLKLKVDFSHRMTVAGEDGKWSKEAHDRNALIFRSRIMRLHGVVGCNISQTNMVVEFMDNMTDSETLLPQLQREFDCVMADEAGHGNAFPDCSGNRIVLTPEKGMVRKPTGYKVLTLTAPKHDLAHYGIVQNDVDWSAFRAEVGMSLAVFSGVRNVECFMNAVRITFDPTFTSETRAKRIVRRAADEMLANSKNFFPDVSRDRKTSPFRITVKEQLL